MCFHRAHNLFGDTKGRVQLPWSRLAVHASGAYERYCRIHAVLEILRDRRSFDDQLFEIANFGSVLTIVCRETAFVESQERLQCCHRRLLAPEEVVTIGTAHITTKVRPLPHGLELRACVLQPSANFISFSIEKQQDAPQRASSPPSTQGTSGSRKTILFDYSQRFRISLGPRYCGVSWRNLYFWAPFRDFFRLPPILIQLKDSFNRL